MTDEPGTYEEWRVTGQPDTLGGIEFPPYQFTWSLFRNPHLGNPAEGARKFMEGVARHRPWLDGPHLTRRTVTVTAWEDAT